MGAFGVVRSLGGGEDPIPAKLDWQSAPWTVQRVERGWGSNSLGDRVRCNSIGTAGTRPVGRFRALPIGRLAWVFTANDVLIMRRKL